VDLQAGTKRTDCQRMQQLTFCSCPAVVRLAYDGLAIHGQQHLLIAKTIFDPRTPREAAEVNRHNEKLLTVQQQYRWIGLQHQQFETLITIDCRKNNPTSSRG